MSEMTLQKMIEHIARTVRPIYAVNGKMLPMYHYITRSGEHRVFAVPAIDNKDVLMAGVRAVLKVDDAVLVVAITEVWYALAQSDEEASAIGGRVHLHPNAGEAVMLIGESETETIHGLMRITRDSAGKGHLGELEIDRPVAVEGRMAGLLPQPPANA